MSQANIRPNPSGDRPQIDPTAYIDPSAQIIGKVIIGAKTFVGPMTVIRADEPDATGQVQPITIGQQCNLQDGVIIHAPAGHSVVIGDRVSLAHGALVHGPAAIANDCFVGIRVQVVASILEESVWVGLGATILDITVPSFVFVPGRSLINTPDRVANLLPLRDVEAGFQKNQVAVNTRLAEGYLALDK